MIQFGAILVVGGAVVSECLYTSSNGACGTEFGVVADAETNDFTFLTVLLCCEGERGGG